MLDIQYKSYAGNYNKNVLYRIISDENIVVEEEHGNSKESVELEFCLENQQYGIFAYEYRCPQIEKRGCKTPDIIAGIVDVEQKKIISYVMDIKRNISAFSDDLLKNNALITAISEVRDYIRQISDGIVSKATFMVVMLMQGFEEIEHIGLVTTNFEEQKFENVADTLENLIMHDASPTSSLAELKFINNIRSYRNMIQPLREFAKRKVVIRDKTYDLSVYYLNNQGNGDYYVSVRIVL